MKKKIYTIFLLILLCASLFATDIALSVKVKPYVDKTGFKLDLANIKVGLKFQADVAGTEANIIYNYSKLAEKRGFAFEADAWAKPNDSVKLTVGVESQFVAENSYIPTNKLLYAGIDKVLPESLPGNLSFEIATLWPESFDVKEVKYYAKAKVDFMENIKCEGTYATHVEAMGKFSFNNGKLVTEKAFAEAYYSPYTQIGKVGYHCYGGSEKGFDTCNDSSMFADNLSATWVLGSSKVFKAGVGYKYAQDNKARDNGAYLTVYAKDYPISKNWEDVIGTSITAKAEIGLHKADAELGVHYRTEDSKFDVAANTKATVYRNNDKVVFDMTEIVAKANRVIDDFGKYYTTETDGTKVENIRFTKNNLFATVKYVSDNENISGNGLFVGADFSGSISAVSYDAGLDMGFKKSGENTWKIYDSLSVNF